MPRARVTNAAAVGAEIDNLARELDRETREAVRGVGRRAVDLFREYAPFRSGRLWDGIRFRSTGDKELQITVHAKDPETGYDYAGVTRFGHRLEVIRPVEKKALHIEFADGSEGLFGQVSGYDPDRDWVDAALPDVLDVADRELTYLGQRLTLKVFT